MLTIVLSLLSAASLGNGAVVGRASLQGVHPILLIGAAQCVGTVAIATAALAISPADLFGVTRTALLWMVIFGLVQFVIGRSSAYTSLSIIGASRVALFISTQVPFAAFFAIAFTGESLGPLVAVGTLGVMIGLLLASGDSFTKGWSADRRNLLGYLMGLTAGAATGASTVLAKQAVSVYDSPLAITTVGMLAATLIVAPAVGIIAARNSAIREFQWKFMGLVALSGLSTTVSIVAQIFAVQRADVLIVAPILATFPLWTLLLSHLFIARLEHITLRLTIGTFITVAGVIAVVMGGQI